MMIKISSILFCLFFTFLLFAQNNDNKSLAKNKIKVFILSGQSNMIGWGNNKELSDSLRYGTDNKLMFEAEDNIPNVKVVVAPNLEKHPKNVHYNTNGQLKLGEYYSKYFLEFANKK